MSQTDNTSPEKHVVVELDGKPYGRQGGEATVQEQLVSTMSMVTVAAGLGQAPALWMVAEVQTPDGPKFVTVRYGVGSNPDGLRDRLYCLVDEFDIMLPAT